MFVALALAISTATGAPALPGLTADLTQVDYILPAQRVVPYGTTTEMRVISNVRLSPDAQTAYDQDFATASFFGAFAVSKDGGWGYSTGTNSLEAARDIALNECLAVKRQLHRPHRNRPAGLCRHRPRRRDVVARNGRALQRYLDQRPVLRHGDQRGWRLFKVWGYPTQAEADSRLWRIANPIAERPADCGLIPACCFRAPARSDLTSSPAPCMPGGRAADRKAAPCVGFWDFAC